MFFFSIYLDANKQNGNNRNNTLPGRKEKKSYSLISFGLGCCTAGWNYTVTVGGFFCTLVVMCNGGNKDLFLQLGSADYNLKSLK